MWRFGFDVPVNYNDMSNYCGGKENQWTVQKGQCGVCGDPFQGRFYHCLVFFCSIEFLGPHDHEDGGIYATGIIGRTYESSTTINTTIDITANHFGYFEFRLCPLDMGHSRRPRRLTQQCLDQYLLKIGPSDSKSNGDDTRYYLPHGNKSYFYVPVELPAEITSCEHCVLQWKYHAGNTWGKDHKGRKCLGCADQQEEFYNCADIAIVEGSSNELITPAYDDNSTTAGNSEKPISSSSSSSFIFLGTTFFIAAKRDPNLDREVQEWIEAIIGEKFPDVPYEEALKDGVVLCKLMNKLQPNAIPKYTTSGGSFKFRENISLFQNAARNYGLTDPELFQTIDLFEKRNIPQVSRCLFALSRQIAGKRSTDLDHEAQEWVEAVIGEKFPKCAYEDALKDGIILCKLINKLQPGSVSKICTSGGGFKLRENVSAFQAAARAYGLPDAELFQTVDLFEKRNIPQVTQCIHALGRHAQRKKFTGPTLGPKMSDSNQRDFSDEQLRAGQSMVGLLNEGMNKGANQSGQNFGLSRHI
ncbi:unnamed protein product [Rotaria sp. Silwood2]|nr:unnamed protein product [Rotaria sp. Silwood2]CAF2536059.1 unnamed protein product [Rotaria sp. Silwood2]CAF2788302.1 unnamed protein product [Rotaria sp. Silwood2]CAF3890228.1 unnamed protein product [Rotaria sp. Silwood2]CAF3934798.1 unnamed protein product [Rotaria sp. Silwood2]